VGQLFRKKEEDGSYTPLGSRLSIKSPELGGKGRKGGKKESGTWPSPGQNWCESCKEISVKNRAGRKSLRRGCEASEKLLRKQGLA